MRSAAEERARLAAARERVRMLTVIGLRDNLTPQQRAAVKDWERSSRAVVQLSKKALDHAENVERIEAGVAQAKAERLRQQALSRTKEARRHQAALNLVKWMDEQGIHGDEH
jgi:hypothetical protein